MNFLGVTQSHDQVPVTSGDTITLRTNAPTHGFNSCNTIYNFYPVDENGNFDPDGEITIHRETGSQFEGLVIAPLAHIRDGNIGNFAGTVVGRDYDWLDQSAGVEIHDWRAAGCSNYSGCLPTDDGTTIVHPGGPSGPSITDEITPGPSNGPTITDVVPAPNTDGECDNNERTITITSTETTTETTCPSNEPTITDDVPEPNTNGECDNNARTITITSTETTTETTTETIKQSDTANTADTNTPATVSVTTVTEKLPGPTQTVYVIGEKHKEDDGYHGGYDKKSKEKKHKKKGGNGYDKFGKSW